MKNVLFNIQSLANQLYHSWSIILDEFELGKIFFLKNLASNLWKKRFKSTIYIHLDF